MAMMKMKRMTRVICAAVVAALVTSCASMPTKEHRAQEAAHLGLVSHPEFADIQRSLDRLEALIDTLTQRVNSLDEKHAGDREGHRDDMEAVMRSVREWIDEMKAEIAKGKQ